MARTRIIEPQYDSGRLLSKTGAVTATRSYARSGYAICTDIVAPGNGYDFTVNKITSKEGGVLNGKFSDNSSAVNFPFLAICQKDAYWKIENRANLGLFSDSYYATKLVAMTNPSRADVDIPVFIAELKDLPGLVQHAGGVLIRQIAKNNLKYQYGIRPLISDLTSMLNFVALTENRLAELRRLGKSGLRRTRGMGGGAYTERFVTSLNSDNGILADGDVTRITQARVWGHVKWFPSAGFPSTDASLLSTARRAVLGLTIDAATAWELIPFSWLADWYGTIGLYLSAKRNIVPCRHTTPQIMLSQKQSVLIMPRSYQTMSKPYHLTGELKQRRLTPISGTTGRLPFLSARQLSILASLIVLKAGKY